MNKDNGLLDTTDASVTLKDRTRGIEKLRDLGRRLITFGILVGGFSSGILLMRGLAVEAVVLMAVLSLLTGILELERK